MWCATVKMGTRRDLWLAATIFVVLAIVPAVRATGPGEEDEKLAEMYAVGRRMADPAGAERNPVMAAYFFFRAAAGGHAKSLAALQEMAREGDPHARFRLGILLEAGKGAPKDAAAAASWWRMAAEQGLGEAQLGLGGLYRDGIGVAADPVQAYLWFSLAAAQGEPGAKEATEELARTMGATQIAEAERLAQEWRATRKTD